jgi:hypothetical protein
MFVTGSVAYLVIKRDAGAPQGRPMMTSVIIFLFFIRDYWVGSHYSDLCVCVCFWDQDPTYTHSPPHYSGVLSSNPTNSIILSRLVVVQDPVL